MPFELSVSKSRAFLERDDRRSTHFVIASAAKQSTEAPMDCFAALAMTIHRDVIPLWKKKVLRQAQGERRGSGQTVER
jgi:hypothetical protein